MMITPPGDDGGFRGVEAEETVKMMIKELFLDKTTVPAADMAGMLESYGVEGDSRMLGKVLKKCGLTYKQTRKGNFYEVLDK